MTLCKKIILALILLLPLHAEAGERALHIGTQELRDIFQEVVFENAPWPEQDLNVAHFISRPEYVTVPAGNLGYRVQKKPKTAHLGRKIVSVTLLVDGKDYGQVKMSGDLQLFGNVICTNKRLSRNSILSEDDISLVRQNISMLDSGLIQDPQKAIGKKIRSSLRAGAILYSQLLESPPLVKRGDLVTIIAQSQSLRVTVPGEVRNTGALGDLVRVKNLQSRREVYAKVLGTGIVETEF